MRLPLGAAGVKIALPHQSVLRVTPRSRALVYRGLCGDAVLPLTPALTSLLFSSFCSLRRMLRVGLCARTSALFPPPFLMWCNLAVMERYAAVSPLLPCSSLGALVFAWAPAAAAAPCPVRAHASHMLGCGYGLRGSCSSTEALP